MSTKIPFEILTIEVDKLYPPYYRLKHGETIDQHLMDIESFIEACGWTTEQYLEEYIHRAFAELLLNNNKRN